MWHWRGRPGPLHCAFAWVAQELSRLREELEDATEQLAGKEAALVLARRAAEAAEAEMRNAKRQVENSTAEVLTMRTQVRASGLLSHSDERGWACSLRRGCVLHVVAAGPGRAVCRCRHATAQYKRYRTQGDISGLPYWQRVRDRTIQNATHTCRYPVPLGCDGNIPFAAARALLQIGHLNNELTAVRQDRDAASRAEFESLRQLQLELATEAQATLELLNKAESLAIMTSGEGGGADAAGWLAGWGAWGHDYSDGVLGMLMLCALWGGSWLGAEGAGRASRGA